MIKVVRASQHRETPWKNGGGVTTEIAVYPPGAGLEDFDWRVSIALMAKSGPFSAFPGVDRRLMLLDGRGLHLGPELGKSAGAMMATRHSDALAFAGDTPIEARVVDGMVAILNVMTRRCRFRQALDRWEVEGAMELQVTAPIALLLCRDGQVSISEGNGSETLDHDDVAVLAAAKGAARMVSLNGEATVYSIELWPEA